MTKRGGICGGLIIVLLACIAYSNTFKAPFVYDDEKAIVANASLGRLLPPGGVWSPPRGTSVEGRPLLNFSLGVNHALGGLNVRGYHVTNLLIHLLASLAWFGVLRRTLGAKADLTAFVIALLWALHPLQTEAVTYVIQRAESLMALFYLLTLYCSIRLMRGGNSCWQWLAAICCLGGMATKEVMVSAPLVVLLYDRAFVAGTFLGAWRQRRTLYLLLAATWLPLMFWVFGSGGNRSGTAGFDIGISWTGYWLTQFRALVAYLRLAFWPHPLIFDYGLIHEGSAVALAPFAALVGVLAAGAGYALWRFPRVGFAAGWFFAILAPTSLIPGTTQMIVEHRMYLALAPLLALAVLAGLSLSERMHCGRLWLGSLVALAPVCCLLTHRRNRDYASAAGLWGDTVLKRPGSARARVHYGFELAKTGQSLQAVEQYQAALAIEPASAETEVDLGNALEAVRGRESEAAAHYRAAIVLRPDLAEAHYDLATRLAQTPGGLPEAISEFETALRLKPNYAEAEVNLANALATAGHLAEALTHYEAALRLDPLDWSAHFNLANVLAAVPGRGAESVAQFRSALELNPGPMAAQIHTRIGLVLARDGQLAPAAEELQAALRLDPGLTMARQLLAKVLAAERGG